MSTDPTTREEIYRFDGIDGDDLVVMRETSGEVRLRVDHRVRNRRTTTGKVVYIDTGRVQHGRQVILAPAEVVKLIEALRG